MSTWKSIDDPPDRPVMVEFFTGNAAPLKDTFGKEHAHDPLRDIRRELGYWDGKNFCELGTGHWLSERLDYDASWYPTHYRILPQAPEI